MKTLTSSTLSLLTVLLLLFSSTQVSAQNEAVDYLNKINQHFESYSKEVWKFISTSAHSRSVKKIAKRRTELMELNKEITLDLKRTPAFNDNSDFRDSVLLYFQTSYDVLNEDYGKIMDMEEIAEQSYDLMEAYMMAQKIAKEKVNVASDGSAAAYKNFAKQNKIELLSNDEDDEFSKKFEVANEVMEYHDEIYLLFFKSYKQELYLLDALNASDLSALEQNKNSLSQFSAEGLEKLEEIGAYKTDQTLYRATKAMLAFYQEEADEKVAVMTEFFLLQEKFSKIQAAFEAKKEKDRTQKDVDQYNKYIELLNTTADKFNATNQYLNEKRSKLLAAYNGAASSLLDKYVPH